jgi:hypothetical protein
MKELLLTSRLIFKIKKIEYLPIKAAKTLCSDAQILVDSGIRDYVAEGLSKDLEVLG